MSLRLLPGLRGLAHRSVELALVDRVEMAGPDQRHPDVAGQDLVRRRLAVPSVLEDILLGEGRAAGQGQHGQAGRRQAAHGTKTRKEGRHDAILPRLLSSMRAARPTTRLYQ